MSAFPIKLFKAYLFSHIHLAICGSIFYWFLTKIFVFEAISPYYFGGMVFLFYNLCDFLGIIGKDNKDMTENQIWIARNMTELVIAMFFCALFIIWLFPSYANLFLYPMPLYIAAGIYILPNSPLRRNIYLKPTIIAFIWVLLPLLINAESIHWSGQFASNLKFLLIFFLFVFNLCIYYDAKDIAVEDEHSMYKVIGANKIGIISLLSAALIAALLYTNQDKSSLFLIPFICLQNLILFLSRNINNALWHLLITDGFLGLIGIYYFTLQLLKLI